MRSINHMVKKLRSCVKKFSCRRMNGMTMPIKNTRWPPMPEDGYCLFPSGMSAHAGVSYGLAYLLGTKHLVLVTV